MEFQGIRLIHIDQLRPSQIYLGAHKIAAIEKWFRPPSMDNFQPLSVHDFGDGAYTITDGHSRAYAAYQGGIFILPAVYDNRPMVAGPAGQLSYQADILWCKRFHLSHISQFGKRIVSKSAYQELWIERCDRSYNLLTRTSPGERAELQNSVSGLPDMFLYGASEDMTVLFFENTEGRLFLYQDNILSPEN